MVETSAGAMTEAPNLSALGKALGETVISSPTSVGPTVITAMSASTTVTTPTPTNVSARKSPKKRERTDSMKTMTPAPAAQRARSDDHGVDKHAAADDGGDEDEDEDDEEDEENEDDDGGGGGGGEEDYSDTSSTAADAGIKLPVKDRTGSAIAGVSRVTLISNAVKTAPPAKEKSNPRRWSKMEDESLRLAVERSGERNWKAIAEQVPGRNHTQCLQRWTKVLKPGLIKGHWDPEEDIKLRDLVSEGKRNWGQVASLIPGRTSKQCRERWCNHLDPNINKGMYTEEEDRIILEMQAKLGNRWSIIAQYLKGRTEDAVKIRWKSLMRGKKAAGKEQQLQHQSVSTGNQTTTITTASAATSAAEPQPLSVAVSTTVKVNDDKSKVKTAPTPTRQKTRAASPVDKPLEPLVFKSEPSITTSSTQAPVLQLFGAPRASAHGTVDRVDAKHGPSAMNSYMQNVNDLVAASIQGYRLSQNFSPGLPVSNGVPSAPSTSTVMMGSAHPMMMSQSTISPMNQPVYSMAPAHGFPGMPPQAQHQHAPHQRQYFSMQQSMSLPPNYVLPTTTQGQQFPVTIPNGHMHPISIQGYQYGSAVLSDGRTIALPPGYPSSSMPMAIPYPSGVPMGGPAYAMAHGPRIPPTHSSMATHAAEPLAPVSASAIPPHIAAGVSSRLTTPREEWGSSQTPRSHLISEEGHASAYELFHQQRLRLMLKEREKGMSLTSAPSPGQAMLTKELKANKERQKRQEMMQQGWKSAVEAMMSLTNDAPSLEDGDGLMEKVSLSALDPTDDELMDSGVEISLPSDDTIVEPDESVLIPEAL